MTEPAPRPTNPTVQQGPVRSTPTVQQGAAPEARPGGTRKSAPTVQQGANPTVQQTESPATQPHADGPTFPEQLRDRFEPLRVLGTGTEGVVWCCRRTVERDEVAVKVHFVGHPVDLDLLRHLDNEAFRRHVPRLFGHGSFFGPDGQVGWVAMELLDATLDQVVTDELSRRWSEPRARVVLRELAQGLHFWQSVVARNPIDFKPDNLMRRANGEFVVADFGGVTGLTASKQIGGVTMAAVAYTPPEQQWEEKGWPWPWWSLGEIAYLLVTGHGRFQRRDGQMLSRQTITKMRTLGELDLGEITDERWRLLITGLLTKDSQDRWGWKEVESWLGGGSPRVVVPAGRTEQPAHSPITFVDGRSFTDPAALAVAMLDDPHAAERWLTSEGRQELTNWLQKEKLDRRFDLLRLSKFALGSARVHSAVLAFGAAFVPEVTPRYRGRPVDRDGLISTLAQPGGFEFAGEVVMGDLLGTAGGYLCGHPGCGPRCAVLDRAAAELPVLVQNVERLIGSTVPGSLSEGERKRLHGMALLLVLSPKQAERALRPSWWLRIADVPWWRPLAKQFANARSAEGRAVLLAQGVLRERVARERPKHDLRPSGRAALRKVGAIVLLAFAMLGITWTVVVLRNGDLAFNGGAEGMRAAATQAAAAQLGLAPQLMLLSAELVLLVRTKGAVVSGAAAAAVLALAAPFLPLFTALAPPDFFAEQVSSLADVWSEGVVVGLVIMTLGGFGMCATARSWLPVSASRDRRRRPVTPARRILVAVLSSVALVLLLWAAVVVRLTVHSADLGVATTGFGAYAALMQSGYLLAIVLVAGIVATSVKRVNGTLAAGVLLVLAAAAYAKAMPELKMFWLPVLREPLLWFADLWGPGALWAALLVHLPLVVLAVRGVRRVTGT